MKNNDDIMTLALKAVRKKNREDEIKYFGKPISYCTVFKNKKKYSIITLLLKREIIYYDGI